MLRKTRIRFPICKVYISSDQTTPLPPSADITIRARVGAEEGAEIAEVPRALVGLFLAMVRYGSGYG